MKKALMVATTGGFLSHFERRNITILQQMGYEVICAANFEYHTYGSMCLPEERDDIRIYQIPLKKEPWHVLSNLRAVLWLWWFVEKESVDLILCHNPMGGAAGRVAGALPHKKRPYVSYTAHGFHFYQGSPKKNWIIYYNAERLLARMTDQLLTINREDYCVARGFFLRRAGMVESIPGVGLDRERFAPRPELRDAVRAELHIPGSAVHLVAASELCENKNLQVVIRAAASIQDSPLYLSICGEGAERENLESLVRELKAGDRIRFLGYRQDMERVLQSADWFVTSAVREGLGMSAIEALACGVPLITSDTRGTREYAQDGINSIVCRENTEEAFCAAFVRILEEPELQAALAAHARRATERFSQEAADAQMRRVYRYADILIEKNRKEVPGGR